jgi:hypothetical protein
LRRSALRSELADAATPQTRDAGRTGAFGLVLIRHNNIPGNAAHKVGRRSAIALPRRRLNFIGD